VRTLDEAQIKAKLLEHQPALNRSGILHLRLFGSKARGDDTPESDVDLMADFDREKRLTLFDVAGLEVELGEILKTRVELCDRQMLKEPVKDRADRESVLVF